MDESTQAFTLISVPMEYLSGGDITLEYEVLKENGEIVDLTLPTTVIEWYLAPQGQLNTQVVFKNYDVDNNIANGISIHTDDSGNYNNFNVHLSPSDTDGFDDIYIYQAVITSNGIVSRKLQGNLLFWANID